MSSAQPLARKWKVERHAAADQIFQKCWAGRDLPSTFLLVPHCTGIALHTLPYDTIRASPSAPGVSRPLISLPPEVLIIRQKVPVRIDTALTHWIAPEARRSVSWLEVHRPPATQKKTFFSESSPCATCQTHPTLASANVLLSGCWLLLTE